MSPSQPFALAVVSLLSACSCSLSLSNSASEKEPAVVSPGSGAGAAAPSISQSGGASASGGTSAQTGAGAGGGPSAAPGAGAPGLPQPSGGSGGLVSDAPFETEFCMDALDAATEQLEGFRTAYGDPTQVPRSFEEGETRLVFRGDWTSGFVAGSFWYIFEHTQDPSWRETAALWTEALEGEKDRTTTHDVGFIMYNSFGNGLRLAKTASYQPILIQTAESLLTRFNPDVGAIRSWDNPDFTFPVIIDNMMNLELLFFASQSSGEPKFGEAAQTHAETTLKNHFRPDHSSYHVVDFDPQTGVLIKKQTHQGIADHTAWSRGQAWGLYGFTMAFRFTQDNELLAHAENIAEFILSHRNLPEDKIPYFDFNAPDYPTVENTRDSSAAAITASSLLELSTFLPPERGRRFAHEALEILRSLASPAYAASLGENGHFLLLHSTGHQPKGTEIDVAINYADYYYLKALLRCSQLSD